MSTEEVTTEAIFFFLLLTIGLVLAIIMLTLCGIYDEVRKLNNFKPTRTPLYGNRGFI